MSSHRPNILLMVTDQERRAPAYESPALARFRDEQLPARRWLLENGVEFAQHYTGATACSPSRPTLLTGQYPSLHAVTQTSGIAKHHGDARLRWLLPRDVPTLGDYFRAAGYDTAYKGKWHVSDADMREANGRIVRSVDSAGERIAAGERRYLDANLLDPYGFDGWVGPEPHGAAIADSGLRRDPVIAQQIREWLQARADDLSRGETSAKRPFLLVACFVNPHDICLWPAWSLRPPVPLADDTVPRVEGAPSDAESLDTKPAAQRSYREAYKRMYGPAALIENSYQNHLELYRRNYYHLHQLVDRQMENALAALKSSPFFDDTIVVFTSDHGELLGSHGGLHQKWFNMYEETVRVPFVVSHAGGFGDVGTRVERALSSHVDLLPTLLGLAGLDPTEIGGRLQATHSEVHPLVGTDLSGLVRGDAPPDEERAVYFSTEDRIVEGDTQVALMAQRIPGLGHVFPLHFDSVHDCAASIEGIVARLDGRKYKLARYFDDPALWSEPEVRDAYRYQAGPEAGELVVRDTPFDEEWELYALDDDPAELHNLAADEKSAPVLARMRALLTAERSAKRLERYDPRPYATLQPQPAAQRPWVDLSRAKWLVRPLDRLLRGSGGKRGAH